MKHLLVCSEYIYLTASIFYSMSQHRTLVQILSRLKGLAADVQVGLENNLAEHFQSSFKLYLCAGMWRDNVRL